MNVRNVVFGGILIVAAAAGSWWLFGDETGIAVEVPPPAADAPSPMANALPTATALETDAVARTQAAAPPPAAMQRPATLRGRCVDAAGSPVADCAVVLHGQRASEERLDVWLRDHPNPPEWTDPATQTTTADGTFVFTFWAPPPFQFTVRITKQDCGAMRGWWSKIDEGAIVDVGDVVMQPGVRLTGRVVDEQSQPAGRVNLSLQPMPQFGATTGALQSDGWVDTETEADGTFRIARPMATGIYMVTARGLQVVRPALLELSASRMTEETTVVVKPAAAMLSIVGVVVDDEDRPIAEAFIETNDGDGPRTVSSRNGKFELKCPRDHAETGVRIAARSVEHEPLRLEHPVPWGTQGLVLRMRRGATLVVRVSDATGAAVDSYDVRLLPVLAREGHWGNTRVRARGPFVDGTATIASVPIGRWLVWVEPPAGAPVAILTAPIEIVDHSARRLDLRLLAATRTLRVVDHAGAPIAGTKIQLADPVEGPIDDRTEVVTASVFAGMQAHRKAILTCEATTNGEGTAILRGPPDRLLTLLLLGPGHVPHRRSEVSLADAGDLVVTVDLGGRVIGHITPPEAIAELRRLAGLPAEGAIPVAQAGTWARAHLSRATAESPRRAGDSAGPFSVDAEGRFEGSGIPAGQWATGVGFAGGSTTAVTVTIREGQTSEAELDLGSLLPGTLAAHVTWNGAPLRDELVHLDSTSAAVHRAFSETGSCDVRTDAQGRFEHRGRPGSYTLTLIKPGRSVMRLRAASSATVARDQTTHHTFAISSGRLELKLVDCTGRPAIVGQITARAAEPSRWASLPATDAAGATGVELDTGDYDLAVLPKSMSPRALGKLLAATPQDPNLMIARRLLAIGRATIQQGQTTTLELRLPPEWQK